MAVLLGDRLKGWLGAVVGLVGVCLPGAAIMLVTGIIYRIHGDHSFVTAILKGVAAAAAGLLLATVIQLGKKSLSDQFDLVFVLVTVLAVNRLHQSRAAHADRRWPARNFLALPAQDRHGRGKLMDQIPALIRVFSYLSLLTVGGGMAAFPEMKILTVDVHKWLDFHQLIHLYSVGQLAPGPNMMMIVAIGDWAGGILGAIVVVIAFFGPTGLLALIVGRAWTKLENWPWRKSIQQGLAPVSIGLLLAGTLSMAKGSVTGWATGGIALGSAADHVVAQGQSRALGAGRRHRRRYRFLAEITHWLRCYRHRSQLPPYIPGRVQCPLRLSYYHRSHPAWIPLEVLIFGGVMLVIIVLLHGAGLDRIVTRYKRRSDTLRAKGRSPHFATFVFASYDSPDPHPPYH